MTYDNERRLATWQNTPSNPTSTASYWYDGEGHRVAQTLNGTTTYYIGDDEEITGSTLLKYYHIPNLPVLGTIVGVTRTYLASDGLGSESVDLSYNGSVLATALYGPYGVGRYATGTMPSSKGYTGQRQDSGSGLDYYTARYYDATAGQFTSADTVQGPNRYGYVSGNPETATDPTGKMRCDDTGSCGSGNLGSGAPTCNSPQSCAQPVPGPCANSGSPQCQPPSTTPCDGPCGDTNQDGVVQPTFGDGPPVCAPVMCLIGDDPNGLLSQGDGYFGNATTVIIDLDPTAADGTSRTAPDGSTPLLFTQTQLKAIEANGDAYFQHLKDVATLEMAGGGLGGLGGLATLVKSSAKVIPGLGMLLGGAFLLQGLSDFKHAMDQQAVFDNMIHADLQTLNKYAANGTQGMSVILTEVGPTGPWGWSTQVLTLQVVQNGAYLGG